METPKTIEPYSPLERIFVDAAHDKKVFPTEGEKSKGEKSKLYFGKTLVEIRTVNELKGKGTITVHPRSYATPTTVHFFGGHVTRQENIPGDWYQPLSKETHDIAMDNILEYVCRQ